LSAALVNKAEQHWSGAMACHRWQENFERQNEVIK
jgi:hypothetical protein